jgi:hypothetical protein
MMKKAFFISYINNVKYKIDESDLIYAYDTFLYLLRYKALCVPMDILLQAPAPRVIIDPVFLDQLRHNVDVCFV